MHGGWRDDIAAIRLNVDARPEKIGPTAEASARMLVEQMSTTTTRLAFDGGWEFAMLGFKVLNAEVSTISWINIDDHEAADGSCGNRDIGLRPAGPPSPNHLWV